MPPDKVIEKPPHTTCERCGTPGLASLGFCLRCAISEQLAEVSPSVQLSPYLEKAGWIKSVRCKLPVDGAGKPLPWITYPAIHFLKQRVAASFRVFEFGSGNSTLWWSTLVESVVACEHDRKWYERMKKVMPANVEYIHHELEYGGAYSQAINAYTDAFDVVIIDGRDRINCARNSIPAMKADGVILWDNSNRAKYAEGYEYLLRNGFRRLDFFGLGPINLREWCTSVFYRRENCLGI